MRRHRRREEASQPERFCCNALCCERYERCGQRTADMVMFFSFSTVLLDVIRV